MRNLLFGLVLLALTNAHAGAQTSVSRLSWMAGCWRQTTGHRVVDEQWMAPRGSVMLGVSRTVKGASVMEYEFMRIYAVGDTLVYSAKPSGQDASDFRAVRQGERDVMFENPAHDFPQRIIYRRVKRDSLIARVEGTRNGQLRGMDFSYSRVACM